MEELGARGLVLTQVVRVEGVEILIINPTLSGSKSFTYFQEFITQHFYIVKVDMLSNVIVT